MKTLVAVLLLTLGSLTASTAQVQWMTLETALERQADEPRKILVDLYTDWCGWCKTMDRTTFSDPTLSKYINENYYPVKFNAESSLPLTFRGKEYKFRKQGQRGYHEFAAHLTRGNLSYPTTVFLNADGSVIQAVPGYQKAVDFEPIVRYFSEDHHRKTPWDAYRRDYVPLVD